MEPAERTRADGEAMHASVRRERLEKFREEERLPRRRACRSGAVDEPQPHMNMEMDLALDGG